MLHNLEMFLAVPEVDLLSLLDWHITVINCYTEPSKWGLQSHRLHGNYCDRSFKGKEKEKLQWEESALSEAEIGFEEEHGIPVFTFTFSFLPFPVNLPHCCKIIVST